MGKLPGFKTETALAWIQTLAGEIGARGSCTEGVRRAEEAVAGGLGRLGVQEVRVELFQGPPSTYRPFMLAFGCAAVGSLLALSSGGGFPLLGGAALNALGAWAMLAETDFSPHWAAWLLPKAAAQNLVGVIRPAGEVRRKAVLCAHIDTHRTPVFYSSDAWLRIFSLMVAGTFAAMALGTLLFGLGILLGWPWLHWAGLPLAVVEILALGMMAAADLTPYTPGANDNASGVAVVMALAERLQAEPLAHTEVYLAITDCEETGAGGAIAYLDAHAAQLGPEAVYMMLDQVGQGVVRYLTTDGLILKHPTHPRALELARAAAAALPEVKVLETAGPAYPAALPGVRVLEMAGAAYTDALPATKRGCIALTLCCVTENTPEADMHWHQMHDTPGYIEPAALEDVGRFTWQVLQEIDR